MMAHFKELRSGKDLKNYLIRTIRFGEFAQSKTHSAKHMMQVSVMKNSFITVYDYDLKIEAIAVVLLVLVFLRRKS